MAGAKSKYRVWKADRDSAAGFMVTPDEVVMAGAKNAFFAANKEGCFISGPLSIMATSESVRRAGIFIEQFDFLKMIPSTIVTPIPMQMPMPPVSLFTSIAKSLPFAIALLASGAV
jgi:hypothetical protein